MTKTILLSAVAALALSTAAQAAPLTAAQLLDSFDAIVEGNATTTSEIVGPVLVGGNLGGGSNILDTSGAAVTLPGYAQVNIYGNHTGTSVEGAGQTVDIGGANLGAFLGPAPTVSYVFPETIASIWSTLTAYSAALAAMPATGSYDAATGAFSGPAGSVFDVTTTELTQPITGLLAGDVVNVTGSTWTDTDNYLAGDAIWNFATATSLTIEDAFAGFILAPYANALVNTAPIEGIAVASYTGEGEVHWGPPDLPDPPSLVSEPPALAGFGLGLLALAMVLRRRGQRVLPVSF